MDYLGCLGTSFRSTVAFKVLTDECFKSIGLRSDSRNVLVSELN